MEMHLAPAMHRRCILRMHGGIAGTISVAHERPKIETVILSYFAPTLPGFMQRDNVV